MAQNHQGDYLTFRLGMMTDAAKQVVGNRQVTFLPNELLGQNNYRSLESSWAMNPNEDHASFYIYTNNDSDFVPDAVKRFSNLKGSAGQSSYMYDLMTLNDGTNAIRIPLDAKNNNDHTRVTMKVRLTNRYQRGADYISEVSTTVGALRKQCSRNNGRHTAQWMEVGARMTSLNDGQPKGPAMNIMCFTGTQSAEARAFSQISRDNRVCSERNPIWDHLEYDLTTLDFVNMNMTLEDWPRKIQMYLNQNEEAQACWSQFQFKTGQFTLLGIIRLWRTWCRRFEVTVDYRFQTFCQTQRDIEATIVACQRRLAQCMQMRDVICRNHKETEDKITHTNNYARQWVATEMEVNQRYRKLNAKRYESIQSIREATKDSILGKIRAVYLKAVEDGERNLEQHRDFICVQMLEIAVKDCTFHLEWMTTRNVRLDGLFQCIKDAENRIEAQGQANIKAYDHIYREVEANIHGYEGRRDKQIKDLAHIREKMDILGQGWDRTRGDTKGLMSMRENLQARYNEMRVPYDAGYTGASDEIKNLQRQCLDILAELRFVEAENAKYSSGIAGLQAKQNLLNEEHRLIEVSVFETRINEYNNYMKQTTHATENLNQEISTVQKTWAEYYERARQELLVRIEEHDNQWLAVQIRSLEAIAAEGMDSKVAEEIKQLRHRFQGHQTSDMDLHNAAKICWEAYERLRIALNEKMIAYNELIYNTHVLMELYAQIAANENEKMMLEAEIDVHIVEVQAKKVIVNELMARVKAAKHDYEVLKRDIYEKDMELERLIRELQNAEVQIDENEVEIKKLCILIRNLTDMCGNIQSCVENITEIEGNGQISMGQNQIAQFMHDGSKGTDLLAWTWFGPEYILPRLQRLGGVQEQTYETVIDFMTEWGQWKHSNAAGKMNQGYDWYSSAYQYSGQRSEEHQGSWRTDAELDWSLHTDLPYDDAVLRPIGAVSGHNYSNY